MQTDEAEAEAEKFPLVCQEQKSSAILHAAKCGEHKNKY